MPVPIGFPGRRLVPPGRANPLAVKWAGDQPSGPSRVQEYSPALELSVFGSFSGVSPGDTLNAVTLTVNQFASTALMGPPTYELWDDSGTPALLGSGTGTTSTSSANVDSLAFPGVTYAMLATLRVRIYAHQGTAPSGAIQNVNWVNLTANITPAANSAGLAHGTGAAQGAQAAVGVAAVLASGAGTARNPAASTVSGTNAQAVLASGAGAARNPAAAAGVNAVPATGDGVLPPAGTVTEDASAPAVAATAGGSTATTLTTAGFSPPAGSVLVAEAIVNYQTVPGSFPALTCSDTAGGAWAPGPAVSLAAAGSVVQLFTRPVPAAPGSITVTLSRAPDAGAAMLMLAVRVATTVNVPAAGAAAAVSGLGTGAGSQVAATVTPRALGSLLYIAAGHANTNASTVISGTTSLQVTSDATDGGVLHAGKASAATGSLAPVTVGWTATVTGPEGYTAAALEILPPGLIFTPAVAVNAALASGAGTALGATAAVSGAATAAATLAGGTGTALNGAAAVGVNAAAATEAGAALNAAPAVAVTAVAATEVGAAQSPAAVSAASVTAVPATGTGTALNPAVTTTASPPVTAATGTGTAQGATVSVAPVAAAATGTGTARNAAAAITVTAVLAAGTGAALGATASTVTSGTANAAPATGTGTARSPAAAVGVNAGPATGTGTAAPVTGPVTAWRLFPSASGPSAPVSYAGNFLCGVIFKVTDGAQWFGGYYKWVATGGDTTARKFALWQVTGAGSGVLLPAATVTSGTLTAGQWNFIPLTTPVKLAIGTAYNACTGWTAVHGFEDSDTAGAGTGATDSFGTGGHTAGIVTGPLTAFSDHAFSRPEPYGMAQGVFSVAGTDPAVTMPSTGSNSANFWMDVQVSPTGPAGYPGPYRLWPGKADTNGVTTTDSPVNYDIATEFATTQPCLLGKVWYFSPPGTAQLATAANVWSITGGGLTGTLAAQAASPSWSGAAASGWVSCTFTGVVLPPGTYKVSVYNSASVPDNWGAKDALTDYWRAGEGGNGITWGPLSAPNLSGASLAYLYDGSMGGHTPPFTDGTTLAGQPTFTQGPPDSYPYLYAPVTSPTTGSTQNYWIDVEVTPVIPAGLATGAGTAQPAAAAVGVSAGLATGAGTAQGATAAAAPAVTAGVASGTGAALGAVAASVASPTAAAATGAGAARNPAAAAGVNAVPATGTGTGQGATVTATASPAAVLATGTGAALNATASTTTAGTANAALATGTGAAAGTFPAVGAAAVPATGTGTALNATVSTAAFTNAQAGLATGTGTARQPSLTLTSNATAAVATGTGTTGSVPAIGVNAAPASGAGTGRNAVGQIGWVAPAGLAAATGTARNPAAVLVALAQAAAATALGAALRATAKTVDPFTVGTLTTATAPLATLTAGATATTATLTAATTRTGGPT